MDDDPTHFRNLSEKLEAILERFGEDWDARAKALIQLAQEERTEQTEPGDDQVGIRVRPIFNAMREAIESPTDGIEAQIQGIATDLVSFIVQRTQIVGFWRDDVGRDNLRKEIWLKLEDSLLFPDSKLDGLADQIIQLAERNDPNQVQ